MVGLSTMLGQSHALIERKDAVIEKTRELFLAHPNGTFTGRGNTKKDVQDRIEFFRAMLVEVAGA